VRTVGGRACACLDGEVDTGWLSRNRSALIAAAAVVPLLVSAVLSLFRDSIAPTTSVLVLVLVVVAAAATGDRTAGVVAALSSGAWFDFFLTQPYSEFTINESADLEATVLLVVVGLGVTELALWGRRQQAHASRSAGYLDGVIGTSKLVSGEQTPPQELTRLVARQIVEVLGIDTCRFLPGPGPGPQSAVLDHDGQVTRRGHRVDIQQEGFPTDEEVALTVHHGGVVHGHFVLTAASQIVRPTQEQLRVAVLLADQVGTALTSHSG
jgi:K+-sensing histidine kinase KdpD